MVLNLILAILAFFSLVLTLWQWLAARRFPLHQRAEHPRHFPAITVLKPLQGCDAETRECLLSWVRQEYAGPIQILFGVVSADDPVCELVRRLIADHPDHDARLVICGEKLGPNGKISKLIQLERLAQHGVFCVSDADVWVPPDLLKNIVEPLVNADVGLVNCLYSMARSSNLAMRWEACAINADFWSQVLQARSFRRPDFALGAVMVTTSQHLGKIGGFTALVDYLADDYHLGNRIARNGARVVLCPIVVECRSSPMSWGGVWSHQLRWARTIRFCQPLPYFFSILSNATLWPTLWLLWHPTTVVIGAAGFCLLARLATALSNEWKLTGRLQLSSCWIAPLKDLLQVVLWALAFLGQRVTWHGERFRVQKGGRLVRV